MCADPGCSVIAGSAATTQSRGRMCSALRPWIAAAQGRLAMTRPMRASGMPAHTGTCQEATHV